MGANTTNKTYYQPSFGADSNSWGTDSTNSINNNFSILDLNLAGVQSVNVAGSADITLTATQARNCKYNLTGILTGSINLIFPSTAGGFYFINNASTGSFTITVKPSGGSGVIVGQGFAGLIFVDATAGTAGFANNYFATLSTSGNATIGGTLAVGGKNPVLSKAIQTFTGSGTYTPTSGMTFAIIEAVGGGGSGGGVAQSSSVGGAGGGGGGGYSRKLVTATDVGASQNVTIGGGGTAGTAGNNAGNAGGDTSLGSLCIAKGGGGGSGAPANQGSAGGVGGVAGTGDFTTVGQVGYRGLAISGGWGGKGGASFFGFGGIEQPSAGNGQAGQSYGGGGGGGGDNSNGGNRAGGAGANGVVIITEFLNV